MNRLIVLLLIALAVSFAGKAPVADAGAQTRQSMTVKIMGVKSKTAGVITFRLAISGMKLDAANMGKRPVAGHGHVQYYLNKIPSDAHRRPDKRNLVAAVATNSYTLSRKTSRVKLPRGRHLLYIALAQNNNVLYNAHPAVTAIVMP